MSFEINLSGQNKQGLIYKVDEEKVVVSAIRRRILKRLLEKNPDFDDLSKGDRDSVNSLRDSFFVKKEKVKGKGVFVVLTPKGKALALFLKEEEKAQKDAEATSI